MRKIQIDDLKKCFEIFHAGIALDSLFMIIEVRHHINGFA